MNDKEIKDIRDLLTIQQLYGAYIYEGGNRTKVRLKLLQKQNALKKRRRKNKLARKSRQVNFRNQKKK